MDATRAAATDLAAQDELEITQKGKPVDLSSFRGPIRLRLKVGTVDEEDADTAG